MDFLKVGRKARSKAESMVDMKVSPMAVQMVFLMVVLKDRKLVVLMATKLAVLTVLKMVGKMAEGKVDKMGF